MALSYRRQIQAEGDMLVQLATECRNELLALDAVDDSTVTVSNHDTAVTALGTKLTRLGNAVTAFGTLRTNAVARFS